MFCTFFFKFSSKTRSSKRTKISYFPVNLILKETLMVYGHTDGHWCERWYLMLIFKIVLLESSEVETDYLMMDGLKIVQTDGNNLLNIGLWFHTFLTKKEF